MNIQVIEKSITSTSNEEGTTSNEGNRCNTLTMDEEISNSQPIEVSSKCIN